MPASAGAIDGVRQLAVLPDPLGQRQLHRELDDGLVRNGSPFPWAWWG